jgi:hypothetical protein
VFYARHDPNRLLEEGVSPIIDYAIQQGEEALNVKLRKKYNEDLSVVDKQFQDVRSKLVAFYQRFDTTKLGADKAKDMDTIVGWALVHGVDKLNATLMKKYDEDLDGSGLRTRLRLFYQANEKVAKSEKDLDDIIVWTLENSVEELNKKLKKKYGKSLVDTSFADMPPPPLVDDARPPAPPPKPSNSSKQGHKAPLPPMPPPDFASALPEENQRQTTQQQLEERLKRFYAKKDAVKNNAKQIERDVKAILSNGIDLFNSQLMQNYGESLNSVRPKTLKNQKKPLGKSMSQVADKV